MLTYSKPILKIFMQEEKSLQNQKPDIFYSHDKNKRLTCYGICPCYNLLWYMQIALLPIK